MIRTDYRLARRQKQLVWAVCRGLSNAQIAEELWLTTGTVKEYLFRLYLKLDIHSRTELSVWAILHHRDKPVAEPKTVTIYAEGVGRPRW